MSLFTKISGILLFIAGLVMAINPSLFNKLPASVNGYKLIEMRVKWGLLLGFGLFLVFPGFRSHWSISTISFLMALTAGVIIGRLLGFILDGFYSKQLWWLLIEFVALFLFGFLYYRKK